LSEPQFCGLSHFIELSFFQPILLPAAGWIDSIPDYPIRKSNPAADGQRRTIAAEHHPVLVTLVEKECGGPVLPSTRFPGRIFPRPIDFRTLPEIV
jgi:hypothetical protein